MWQAATQAEHNLSYEFPSRELVPAKRAAISNPSNKFISEPNTPLTSVQSLYLRSHNPGENSEGRPELPLLPYLEL